MSTRIYLISFVLFLYACAQDKGKDSTDTVSLSGKFPQIDQTYLLFEELTPSELIFIDSIPLDEHGNFTHSFTPTQSGFFRLGTDPSNFLTLVIDPGDEITIQADSRRIGADYKISGSPHSEILRKLKKNVLNGIAQADSLRRVYHENKRDENFTQLRNKLNEEYDKIKEEQREYVISVIENNPQSLVSILALYQYFEDHILIKERDDFEYFQSLSNSLEDIYPANKHVIDLKKRVSDQQREIERRKENEISLQPGKPAPEIALSDPEGNRIALSSLQGQLVLLDFWAAWCPPCREANKTLRKVYDEYKNLGFEIYSVSLDRSHSKWLNAIEDDRIDWIQVSDLRYMNSPVLDLYNVTNIPHQVLIDRQGKIVKRGVEVEDLHRIIEKHL